MESYSDKTELLQSVQAYIRDKYKPKPPVKRLSEREVPRWDEFGTSRPGDPEKAKEEKREERESPHFVEFGRYCLPAPEKPKEEKSEKRESPQSPLSAGNERFSLPDIEPNEEKISERKVRKEKDPWEPSWLPDPNFESLINLIDPKEGKRRWKNRKKTFVDRLLELIRLSGKKDSEIYHAAQIDRRLYSKIIKSWEYLPSKDTCIAFCLALKLSVADAKDLLYRAGYALSPSDNRDLVFRYFIENGQYDIFVLNEILEKLNLRLL